MKAVMRTQYGKFEDILSIKEVEKPTPKDNEILVKVYATTINRTDCAVTSGYPSIIRIFTGIPKPKQPIVGTDFAGVVEAIGKNVKLFKTGDQVFGFEDTGIASQAEYMVINENKPIAIIPENVSFEQAVASLEGAHYAINFFNKVKLNSSHKVLINGASGAIGSAAAQFLKAQGLYVAVTCPTNTIEQVRSWGVDKIMDYTQEDFTKDNQIYDFVFDAVGKSSFGECKPLLSPKGVYISSELGKNSQNPFLALITPFLGGKKVIFPLPSDIKASLKYITDILKKGKFKPLIDRAYSLDQVVEAYQYVNSGKKIGNVILSIHPAI
ncbi:MAG: NAD(P)-dependent alcohol dehydrogenase [Raineya sp.]|jgi:NADPH:quinone reductase-like Zn-dependent oxidoreductase|nr:NAD(P)-dependent alcohol dehydrogenase [Raineya sp.]